MATIIRYKELLINLDHMVRAYRDELETTVELANGAILKLPWDTFDLISGRDYVVRAFPVDGVYANFCDKEGFYQEKVMFMGICANGCIRPMNGLQGPFASFMDRPSLGRYCGLTDTKMDKNL